MKNNPDSKTDTELEQLRYDLLDVFLRECCFDGWSVDTLQHAATSLGHDARMAFICFPGGLDEVIDYYHDQLDQQMTRALDAYDINALRIRERIKTIILERLGIMQPHKEAIRGLAEHYLKTLNAPSATSHLWHNVDTMWRLAGDTATDYNFYTKRLLLAGVYVSSVLYWLNNASDSEDAVEQFVEQRIENVMTIQKAKSSANQFIRSVFPFGRQAP